MDSTIQIVISLRTNIELKTVLVKTPGTIQPSEIRTKVRTIIENQYVELKENGTLFIESICGHNGIMTHWSSSLQIPFFNIQVKEFVSLEITGGECDLFFLS